MSPWNSYFEDWADGGGPSAAKPVRVHFCPDGSRCALAITDHGDRTRTPISRAIYFGHSRQSDPRHGRQGIVPSGVRITQGTFCTGWEGFDYLDNPQFLELMKQLHQSGSEVCPHNTSERHNVKPDVTRKQMELFAEHFGLVTWIDHYRLPSNLTREGMDPSSEYFILDQFQRLGGKVAWSFVDRYVNPPNGELSLLARPAVTAYLREIISLRLLSRGRREAAIRLRSTLGELLGRTLGPAAATKLIDLRRNISCRRETLKWLAALHAIPRDAWQHLSRRALPRFPVYQHGGTSLYWFDTCRVTFVSQCYRAEHLDRLIQQCGVHLGHTYLGFDSPRHFDFAFERDGAEYAIQPAFQSFLEYLAKRIATGEVWNPTMRQMQSFYEQLSQVRLQGGPHRGWRLMNNSQRPVRGVTLRSLMPLQSSAQVLDARHPAAGEHWYVVDLAPYQVVDLAAVATGHHEPPARARSQSAVGSDLAALLPAGGAGGYEVDRV